MSTGPREGARPAPRLTSKAPGSELPREVHPKWERRCCRSLPVRAHSGLWEARAQTPPRPASRVCFLPLSSSCACLHALGGTRDAVFTASSPSSLRCTAPAWDSQDPEAVSRPAPLSVARAWSRWRCTLGGGDGWSPALTANHPPVGCVEHCHGHAGTSAQTLRREAGVPQREACPRQQVGGARGPASLGRLPPTCTYGK